MNSPGLAAHSVRRRTNNILIDRDNMFTVDNILFAPLPYNICMYNDSRRRYTGVLLYNNNNNMLLSFARRTHVVYTSAHR